MQKFGSGEQREPERAFETGEAGWMNWSQESKQDTLYRSWEGERAEG